MYYEIGDTEAMERDLAILERKRADLEAKYHIRDLDEQIRKLKKTIAYSHNYWGSGGRGPEAEFSANPLDYALVDSAHLFEVEQH